MKPILLYPIIFCLACTSSKVPQKISENYVQVFLDSSASPSTIEIERKFSVQKNLFNYKLTADNPSVTLPSYTPSRVLINGENKFISAGDTLHLYNDSFDNLKVNAATNKAFYLVQPYLESIYKKNLSKYFPYAKVDSLADYFELRTSMEKKLQPGIEELQHSLDSLCRIFKLPPQKGFELCKMYIQPYRLLVFSSLIFTHAHLLKTNKVFDDEYQQLLTYTKFMTDKAVIEDNTNIYEEIINSYSEIPIRRVSNQIEFKKITLLIKSNFTIEQEHLIIKLLSYAANNGCYLYKKDFKNLIKNVRDRRYKSMANVIYKSMQGSADKHLTESYKEKKINFDNLIARENQIIVLDFWASWCKPCMENIPAWKNIQQKYPSLKYIEISLDNDRNKWLNTINYYNMDTVNTFRILPNSKEYYLAKFGFHSIPKYIVIDRNKSIIFHSGEINELNQHLEKLILR